MVDSFKRWLGNKNDTEKDSTNSINCEELQTALLEVEQIVNNRPRTYYYLDNGEAFLRSWSTFGQLTHLLQYLV